LLGLALLLASIAIGLPLYVVLIANHNFPWQSTKQNNISPEMLDKKPVNQTRISHKRKKSLMKSHRKWNLFDT
jgi:hypothetical protein